MVGSSKIFFKSCDLISVVFRLIIFAKSVLLIMVMSFYFKVNAYTGWDIMNIMNVDFHEQCLFRIHRSFFKERVNRPLNGFS